MFINHMLFLYEVIKLLTNDFLQGKTKNKIVKVISHTWAQMICLTLTQIFETEKHFVHQKLNNHGTSAPVCLYMRHYFSLRKKKSF